MRPHRIRGASVEIVLSDEFGRELSRWRSAYGRRRGGGPSGPRRAMPRMRQAKHPAMRPGHLRWPQPLNWPRCPGCDRPVPPEQDVAAEVVLMGMTDDTTFTLQQHWHERCWDTEDGW